MNLTDLSLGAKRDLTKGLCSAQGRMAATKLLRVLFFTKPCQTLKILKHWLPLVNHCCHNVFGFLRSILLSERLMLRASFLAQNWIGLPERAEMKVIDCVKGRCGLHWLGVIFYRASFGWMNLTDLSSGAKRGLTKVLCSAQSKLPATKLLRVLLLTKPCQKLKILEHAFHCPWMLLHDVFGFLCSIQLSERHMHRASFLAQIWIGLPKRAEMKLIDINCV